MNILFRLIFRKYINEYKKMEQLCKYDTLTGIHNRLQYEIMKQEIDYSKSLGIVYADLNMLKDINDLYGHAVGDIYIKDFATILSNIFEKDNCYRIGGDEFVVIIQNIDPSDFTNKVNKLKYDTNISNKYIASIGYDYKCKPNTIEKMILVSERIMYEDKKLYHEIYKNSNAN